MVIPRCDSSHHHRMRGNPRQTGHASWHVLIQQHASGYLQYCTYRFAPWRVLFVGLWANNFDGAGLAQPGFVIEATTALPTFTIGSLTMTVSKNGSNQLQVSSSSNNTGFTGTIFVSSGNQSIAGTESARFKGDVGYRRPLATAGTLMTAAKIVPAAGWETTATVTNVTGTDAAFVFQINSSGKGQTSQPTITVTFADGTWTTAPVAVVCQNTGNTSSVIWNVQSSATTLTLQPGGLTPGAGQDWVVNVISMGKPN